MQVPFYDFQSLHNPELIKEIKKRTNEIIDNNSFVEGPFNHSFEKAFAEKQGAKFCALVGNGTDALEIALKVAGVEPGDLVAVASISFFASVEAVINIGATPFLIEVEPQTGLIDVAAFKKACEKNKFKALMPVHIYGQPADIESLEAICQAKEIKIVEDAAQAQGGFYKNKKPVGSSSNFVSFSFYPTKNLAAFGDAGAILCQEEKDFETILSYRNHGRSPSGHALIGRNSRCDHMQAAVLDAKLQYIDQWNEQRRSIAAKLRLALAETPLRLPPNEMVELSSWHLFPVGLKTSADRESFEKHLLAHEITPRRFYERSLRSEPVLKSVEGDAPNSEIFGDTTVCLPNHPFVSDEQIVHMQNTIHKYFS